MLHNPRWPIWVESGAHLGKLCGLYMSKMWAIPYGHRLWAAIWAPYDGHVHMGPIKFGTRDPCGAHMGNPRGPIWVESGAHLGKLCGLYMGQMWAIPYEHRLWAAIWVPHGHAHMGPIRFCNRDPCGAHMGNPRWPIWVAFWGPIWVNYVGYYMGKMWAIPLWASSVGCNMGPTWACPYGAHVGKPSGALRHLHPRSIWDPYGGQMGPISLISNVCKN